MIIDIRIGWAPSALAYNFEFDDVTGVVTFIGTSDPTDPPPITYYDIGDIIYTDANWNVIFDEVIDYSVAVAHSEAIVLCTAVIDSVTVTPDLDGTNSGTVTIVAHSDTTVEYSLDGITWQPSGLFENLPAGNYFGYARETEVEECLIYQAFIIEVATSLVATIGKTDVSYVGGNDGTLFVQVQSAALAGGIAYITVQPNWEAPPPVASNGSLPLFVLSRTNLVAGTYTVTVTDTISGQTLVLSVVIGQPVAPDPDPEPTPDEETGSILRFPLLNSIHFIVPDGKPQGLDNTLLCQQYYKGIDRANYFQPQLRNYTPTIQWESDFNNFSVRIFNYIDNTLVREFGYQLKEQNLGIVEDYAITIRNHTTVGQSRIYFGTGLLPIPLNTGDVFAIINNADGFDGSYAIVAIVSDTLAGTQYLVINKNYAIGPSSSSADGRFGVSNSDYNVYESQINFVGLDDGLYFIVVVAGPGSFLSLDDLGILVTDDGELLGDGLVGISEPINVQEAHPGTFELLYRNNDDGYGDITWSTGYTGKILVPGHVGNKRLPGGERSTSRNADYSLTKINAKKTRVVPIDIYTVPPYMIEKLSTVFDCDYFTLNEIEYQTNDSLESSQLDRDLMANASIDVETKGWFKKYNSDDIGTVDEQGFITTEQGFIQR